MTTALMPNALAFRPGLFGEAGFSTNDLVSLLQNPVNPAPVDLRQYLILFGMLAILTFFLFLAVAWYKRARYMKFQRSAWPAAASKNSPNPSRLSARGSGRRRRQGKNLKSNPTLAEIGSLPPRRPEGQPPSGL